MGVDISIVSPGYFAALQIPVLAGREFSEADDKSVPLAGVVNEAFAQRYCSGRDPLGLSFNTGRGDAHIVGVVKTGKYRSLNEPLTPYVYLSAGQVDSRDLGLVVRTSGDPRHLANGIRRLAASIDPDVTPHAAMTYEEYVAAAFTVPRVAATLLSALGLLALLLAVLGIYAVISQNVNQRTREFGVRLALGARRSDVQKLVLMQGIKLAVVGMLLGALAGFGASRTLENLLVGVSAWDLATWILVPVLLFAAAFVACWLPAHRAARVDPMTALRYE
jgi:predicted permease